MAQEEIDEDRRAQPLLDSVRSLVNKERQLAGLQLEDKEWEAELWRNKFLKLQEETGGFDSSNERGDADRARTFPARGTCPGDIADDWDDLQAASKKTGDSYLRKLRRKESLDFSRRGIGKEDLEGIATKLRWLRGFTSIDLSDNSIDDACVQPLKNLMALRQVRRLDLGRNDLGPSAGKVLLDSLPRCKELQVLRLEANVLFSRAPDAGARLGTGLRAAIKAGGCRHLWDLSVTLDDFDSTFFQNAPRKTKLKKTGGPVTTIGSGRGTNKAVVATPALPRRNPADPMNALAFTRAFHPRASGGGLGALLNGDDGGGGGGRGRDSRTRKGSITSLGLPYARLHPRTVEELAAYAISSLTHLDLSFCYIGPAGAATLARALDGCEGDQSEGSATRGRGSRSLRSLKLPHNAIGDSGACALSRALQSNRCLKSLSLASNGIGPAGGRALAEVVGQGGSTLACVDVGDNPLGEDASRLLVAAVTTGPGGDLASPTAGGSGSGSCGRGNGGAGEEGTVRIQGLGRAAGATVAAIVSAEKGMAIVAEGSNVLIAVHEEVSVQSGDAGLLDQVYQIILDSRFESPADERSSGGVGETDGEATLDIQWSVTTSSVEACEWRVSRKREGEPEFRVKEWVGADAGLAGRRAKGTGDEPRDGYSTIRLRCNGWRKHDLLKIFVRSPDGGAGPVKCCDLTIGLVKGEPSLTTHGLLWADPEDVDGAVDWEGRWADQDRPRSPSTAERAEVAFQMSNSTGSCSAISGQTETQDTDNKPSSAYAMHRLRHVHVGHGGRIRASWQAILATSPLKPLGGASSWGRSASGGRGHGERLPRRGYSWAIVRTRGVLGHDEGGWRNQAGGDVDDTCGLSCRVILQGSVPDPSTHTTGRGIVSDAEGGVEEDGGRDSGNGGVDLESSRTSIPSAMSPWRWHSLGVDTTGWLPGDLLSLWIQVDEVRPRPPLSCVAEGMGLVDNAAAAAQRAAERGEHQRLNSRFCHLRVRAFSLRVVDDAEAEEIVRRAHCLPCRHPLVLGNPPILPRPNDKMFTHTTATIHSTGRSKRGEAHVECHFATTSLSAASSSGMTAAVRLDFAAVCPMNMAAAGGSWA